MAFLVVCLSAVDGAEGDRVGTLVAERLGYRIVDEEIVALAAGHAECDPQLIADAERRKSLIDRVLDRLAPAAATASMGACTPPPADETPSCAAVRDLLRATIHQIAEEGRVVIMAHAGSYALGERGDTLRVHLTGSPDVRAKRLGNPAQHLTKLDADRADYLKRFYGVCAEKPHHYDLVLNTDRLDPASAAAIIANVASA